MSDSPLLWTSMNEFFAGWWRDDIPIDGVILAIIMAVLRMAYAGSNWKGIIFEGLMCGALALTIYSALNYLEIPASLTICVGGIIGFIGVEKLSIFIFRFIDGYFGGGRKK